ncbi:MAG: outer membrane protein assembly factor BamD [Candidatus Babeliales bacterium]
MIIYNRSFLFALLAFCFISTQNTFSDQLSPVLLKNDASVQAIKPIEQSVFIKKTAPQEKKSDQELTVQITNKRYPKKVVMKKPIKKPQPIVLKDPAKDRLLKKTIRDMTIDELIIAKEYASLHSLQDLVLKYIERLIVLAKDPDLLSSLRLELADIYFEKAEMKKAGKLYLEYVKFYPGSKKRDYAEYKAVLTRFYARLKPPLDQSKTRKTIILANHYLERSNATIKEYTQEIEKMRIECYQDLYEYEVGIFYQYLNRERWIAAQTRLKNIKEELLPAMHDIEPHLLELEGLLAQKQGNETLVNEMLAKLQTNFPKHTPTVFIAHNKTKKSYVDRF